MAKTFEEINAKIRQGQAVVVTAEEMVELSAEQGVKEAAKRVDVVTTGTFGPMCSSGAFINFGHSEPPIRMSEIYLNDVPASGGIAAVDTYIGATELSRSQGMAYGGAHVIQDLIEGKSVRLEARSPGTDCYPRKKIDTWVSKEDLNQAYLYNPRNAYQNYPAAANTSGKTIYTYMGRLLPECANINYSTSGELSPLLKDPTMRTIGMGTRIFLCGGVGYVAWEGTQYKTIREDLPNGDVYHQGRTVAVMGNLKDMSGDFIRAAVFEGYGVTMYVGIGIPIPVLDEDLAAQLAVSNDHLYTYISDYSAPGHPSLKRVSYAELRSGNAELNGKKVPAAALSSLNKAREIAAALKDWIGSGEFLLQEPIARFPDEQTFKPLMEKEAR
jgi:uncharacterized protein (DUF39 family)